MIVASPRSLPLQVVRKSDTDKVTVVGAGVTLVEAVKAAEILQKDGINVRIVDPFTLKPIDKDLLISCAKATGGLVVTVEDHYAEGEGGGGDGTGGGGDDGT